MGLHLRNDCPRTEERPGQINAQNVVPVFQSGVFPGDDGANAGIVDQDIDAAESVHGSLDHGFDLLGVGYVRRYGNDLSPVGLHDFLCG